MCSINPKFTETKYELFLTSTKNQPTENSYSKCLQIILKDMAHHVAFKARIVGKILPTRIVYFD